MIKKILLITLCLTTASCALLGIQTNQPTNDLAWIDNLTPEQARIILSNLNQQATNNELQFQSQLLMMPVSPVILPVRGY